MRIFPVLMTIFLLFLALWGLFEAPLFTILCGVIVMLLLILFSMTRPHGRRK